MISKHTTSATMGTMKYIAFEGIDGAGKTTQLARLAKFLERKGVTPIQLAEPTYGSYGSLAREMIVSGQIAEREKLHELLMLDRKEHIERKILPILQLIREHKSFALLQDRCYLSAPAYQGSDDEDAMRLLREEQSYAPRPDTIVLLRVPPALAIERLKKRAGDDSPFKTEEAFAAVQARYEQIANDKSENVLTIDGTGSEEEVHRLIVSALEVSYARTEQ